MGVPMSAFRDGDVYIDFPYEEVMFHFEKTTGKIRRKFYGTANEDEVPRNSKLFAEACSAGEQTTDQVYRQGRPRFPKP